MLLAAPADLGALLLLLVATTPISAQNCFSPAVYSWGIYAAPSPVPEGTRVTLQAQGLFGCPPVTPYACDPIPYWFESCDTLQWTFGDGTAATGTGSGSVAHVYAHRGLYDVTVHVARPSGSTDISSKVYVASVPATVINSVTYLNANELDGSVTVHLTRSGDLSQTNRVDWRLYGDLYLARVIAPATGTLTFLPGESEHTLTFPMTRDHAYEGEYVSFLRWNLAGEGAVAGTGWTGDINKLELYTNILIADAETQPSGVLQDVVVSKGSPVVHVPIDLTGAFASPMRWSVYWYEFDGSAVDKVDYAGSHPWGVYELPPHTMRAFITIPLIDNPQPGTRSFDIDVFSSSFHLTRSRAKVTIADDSFHLAADPANVSLVVGSDAALTVTSSSPLIQPVAVTVASSDPGVFAAEVPAAIPVEGSATIAIHAIKPGRATLTITPAGGSPAVVDVQVVPGRRRAVSR